MIPPDLTHLADVLLAAAAAGATIAFAYLAGRRVPTVGRFKPLAVTVAIALPAVLLAWLVTQPELGIRSAYGNATLAAVDGPRSPDPFAVALAPPVAEGRPGQPISASAEVASFSPSPATNGGNDQGGPVVPPPPTSSSPAPPTTPSPSPSPSPSPTETTAPPSPTSPTAPPTQSDTADRNEA
jgi:hypothetical protein